MNKSQKIIAISLGITLLIVTVIGFTYAYFLAGVTGNEQASSLVGITADLGITFTDGSEVKIDNAFPGDYVEKEFNVRNTGSDIVYFDINLKEVYTTIIKDEVVYYLYKKDSNGDYQLFKGETLINNDAALFTRIGLSIGETQYYKIKVQFKELGSAQNYNQGGMFSGTINILSPYTYYTEAPTITLKDRILLDNTSYADNVSSKYVTTNGINFANPSDYGYDGYTTRTMNVNLTSNANRQTADSFVYEGTSGKLSITSSVLTYQTYSSASIGKYTCKGINYSHCFYDKKTYKILEVSGSTVTKAEVISPKPKKDSWNGLGLYNTSTNTEGNNITHYFRGDVKNNYVLFGDFLWQVVRINEDGSVRLLKLTHAGGSTFNSASTNKMYVGYMYGTAENPYANTTNSSIKTVVDTWYDTNLINYSNYLADAGFCNDRKEMSTSGTTVYYRMYNGYNSPRFGCQQTNDLFTLTTSSKGNKALTKPIGLISMDEILYAGGAGARSKFTNSYIERLDLFSYYTMTPRVFNGTNAYVTDMHLCSMTDYYPSTHSINVLPVVNLKSSVLVIGGSGTENDPYRVSLNDTTNKYVSDNSLVLHYDAIDNTPNGHSDSAPTWYDLSGNGNNGTLNGFDQTSTSGWQSNSLAFDGINDSVTKLNATYNIANQYTLEITMLKKKDENYQMVFNTINSGNGRHYMSVWYSSGWKSFVSNSNSNSSTIPFGAIDSNYIVKLSTTLNSNVLKTYKNGNVVNTSNLSYIPEISSNNLYMSTIYPFEGNIYSVRVYNRALTDSEIRKNYLVDKERFGL